MDEQFAADIYEPRDASATQTHKLPAPSSSHMASIQMSVPKHPWGQNIKDSARVVSLAPNCLFIPAAKN